MKENKHKYGDLESIKFDDRRESFSAYLDFLRKSEIDVADFQEHFTAYVGHMSLNRTFALYEYYKMVNNVAGHIAEVGVYKGAGSILFAKLVRIFESEALTQVHGFDWFKGTGEPTNGKDSDLVPAGGYKTDYDDMLKLIKLQNLDRIIHIHNFDIRKQIDKFFEQHKHLQFKLVFMDAGMYDVMQKAIPAFWQRLTPGGIMIFDQFSHELAPGETLSIRELLPNSKIKTLPNSWMPNAYVIKE
jgi:hypothetical protein